MTQKHTPGPWSALRYAGEISGPDGEMIAPRVFGSANARLIAAAPELLEALEAVVATCKAE